MRKQINGVLCDTESSTLVATREEDAGVSTVFGKTISLYRTVHHRFFRYEASRDDAAGNFQLLTKEEAMDFHGSFKTHVLDFDETFDSD